VERTLKTITYDHQACSRLLLPSALINKIRICCTPKVRLGGLRLVCVYCPVSLVSRCVLRVSCNFTHCEKGKLGMLTETLVRVMYVYSIAVT
jgi:hypothetical protein